MTFYSDLDGSNIQYLYIIRKNISYKFYSGEEIFSFSVVWVCRYWCIKNITLAYLGVNSSPEGEELRSPTSRVNMRRFSSSPIKNPICMDQELKTPQKLNPAGSGLILWASYLRSKVFNAGISRTFC